MKYLNFLTAVILLLLFSCEVSKHYTEVETTQDYFTFNDELEFKINLYKGSDRFNEGKSNLIVSLELDNIKDNYTVDSLNIKLFDSKNKECSINHSNAFYLTKDTINKSSYFPWVTHRFTGLNDSTKTLTKLMTQGFNYDYFFNISNPDNHKKYSIQLFVSISREGKVIKITKNIIFKRHTMLLPLKLGC